MYGDSKMKFCSPHFMEPITKPTLTVLALCGRKEKRKRKIHRLASDFILFQETLISSAVCSKPQKLKPYFKKKTHTHICDGEKKDAIKRGFFKKCKNKIMH